VDGHVWLAGFRGIGLEARAALAPVLAGVYL